MINSSPNSAEIYLHRVLRQSNVPFCGLSSGPREIFSLFCAPSAWFLLRHDCVCRWWKIYEINDSNMQIWAKCVLNTNGGAAEMVNPASPRPRIDIPLPFNFKHGNCAPQQHPHSWQHKIFLHNFKTFSFCRHTKSARARPARLTERQKLNYVKGAKTFNNRNLWSEFSKLEKIKRHFNARRRARESRIKFSN